MLSSLQWLTYHIKAFLTQEYGTHQMKTKLLFWSAVLFLVLGLNTGDGTLFIFFSIHSFMLFIGVFVRTQTHKFQSRTDAEPLPQVPSTKN
jgi:hypothetical protein